MKIGKYILAIVFLVFSGLTLKADNYAMSTIDNEGNVLVYPNPAIDDHVLISSEKEFEKIELLNIIGQLIVTRETEATTNVRLELGNLKTGIYLIKITFTDKTSSTKRLRLE